MDTTIKVVQYGLGPIGIETARKVLEKSGSGLKLVAAIDIDPQKAGKDLGEVIGLNREVGIVVSDDAEAVLQTAHANIALHATSSFLDKVFSQIETCIKAGVNVVSSTEELFYPYDRHPDLASSLDTMARRHRVTVVGTGVNPGFVMDTLALLATGACTDVRSVKALRIVDASSRRLPLQRKIGAGLTVEEFKVKKKTGTFGHIGLRESLLFVASGLGWSLDRIEEELDPVVAEEEVVTPHVKVASGQVSGIHHVVSGYVNSKCPVILDLTMCVGAKDPHDAITVDGDPPIELVIKKGIFGDSATVAALVNSIPLVIASPPGLMTTKDLPVLRALCC